MSIPWPVISWVWVRLPALMPLEAWVMFAAFFCIIAVTVVLGSRPAE